MKPKILNNVLVSEEEAKEIIEKELEENKKKRDVRKKVLAEGVSLELQEWLMKESAKMEKKTSFNEKLGKFKLRFNYRSK